MAKTKKQQPPLTPATMGALRWKGTTKAQRSEIARAAVLVRHARNAALRKDQKEA